MVLGQYFMRHQLGFALSAPQIQHFVAFASLSSDVHGLHCHLLSPFRFGIPDGQIPVVRRFRQARQTLKRLPVFTERNATVAESRTHK